MKTRARRHLKILLVLFCLTQANAQSPKSAQKPNAAKIPDCSTQKVNRDCRLVFDRLDPISLPNIQMHRGARIFVSVLHPLQYETLTLDAQAFQIVPPSDQAQGLVSAIIGANLKNLAVPTVTASNKFAALAPDPDRDLKAIDQKQQDAVKSVTMFVSQVRVFYAQVTEILAPLPRPVDGDGDIIRLDGVPDGTPEPWTAYSAWRDLLLCELAGATPMGGFPANLVSSGGTLQANLTPPPPQAPATTPGPPPALNIDSLVAKATQDIAALPPGSQQDQYKKNLADLQDKNMMLINNFAGPWLTGVTAINKDLQSYLVNIREATTAVVASKPIGSITDPFDGSGNTGSTTNFLGRSVTYSVNAVNQIGVATTSVPTASQKTSVATVSVLYADPIFEVSTGAFFSTIPSRTFSNMTEVTGHTGTMITTGNVVITQSIIQPTVIPYAAGNWRLGPNFLIGQRRAAVYFTTAVGFNAYNTTAEYAVGPSLGYRNIMISPLLHIGHDIHLTQGETVGEILCSTVPSASNACVGAPPPPSTKYYWRIGFALGIGIRIPTGFGTTTGR